MENQLKKSHSDIGFGSSSSPVHVAIVMDGNGRWAARRGLPRIEGHRAGAERLRGIIEACPDLGVDYLTVFAFSTENWKRGAKEVGQLIDLFRQYMRSETQLLKKHGVKIRFIGGRGQLDKSLVMQMRSLELATEQNNSLSLTVALNYGGRQEITNAVVKIAREVAEGSMGPEDISQDTIASAMETSDLPDPDLIIRTSGETRISNFLLWQSAYSEFEFVDTFWPDFTPEQFKVVVNNFSKRERRFGAIA